ncbi:MAG TPA: methyltransferase domain-containing protein [Thermoanaerobaculia bacterium]|jgi:SAM-dependent methyltransferase
MPVAGEPPAKYALGHSDQELERLGKQGRLVGPITRRFFEGAGLAPGMRVLDVGSGAGDVAFLAAELVGERGEVVGADRSADAVAKARARAAARSLRHVSFREGDPAAMEFDRPFDAVVGRYVLLYQPDPAAMLRKLAASVRAGGVLVFHEPDWYGVHSNPKAPLYERCSDWIVETLRRSGASSDTGLGLHRAFVGAGLPAPTMRLDALIGGGPNAADLLHLNADIVRSLLPEMERLGVATAAEVEIESLAERMIAEAVAANALLVGRYEVGAWSRT